MFRRSKPQILDYLYAKQVRQMARFPENNTIRVMEDIEPGYPDELQEPPLMRATRKELEAYRVALTEAMVAVRRAEKHGDRTIELPAARESLAAARCDMEKFFARRHETDVHLSNDQMVQDEVAAINSAMDRLEDCVKKGIVEKPQPGRR
jgi:hypothetical protein